jgi:hypothetical protein
MNTNKLPEEMAELVAIGTIPDDAGMHQPKVTRLSTGEEVKVEMVTMSRVRAVAAARRSAEKAGFIVVDVACPKCHKNSSAEHARGQREALLEALRQIDIVRGQAVDLLFCLLGRSASSTNGRIRGLDEASREVQALLARVGRHEEDPSV